MSFVNVNDLLNFQEFFVFGAFIYSLFADPNLSRDIFVVTRKVQFIMIKCTLKENTFANLWARPLPVPDPIRRNSC